MPDSQGIGRATASSGRVMGAALRLTDALPKKHKMDIAGRTRVLLRNMSEEKTNILRLPKKHAPKVTGRVSAAEGGRLVEAQSLRDALVAGLVAVTLFTVLWSMLSVLLGRIFPWLTLFLGICIGLVVRRAGRGLDWRFPVLAALLTLLGSLAGNIAIAANFTAAEFETGTLTVLGAVTTMTWPVFFAEVMTPVDLIYGLFSAAVAAFYANRRLTRAEFLALRKWEHRGSEDEPARANRQ